jgi:hypothetical protein
MSLADDIAAQAIKAKRLRSGSEEREAHSLKDQIEAAKFDAAQSAVTGTDTGQGFRLQKFRAGGTV